MCIVSALPTWLRMQSASRVCLCTSRTHTNDSSLPPVVTLFKQLTLGVVSVSLGHVCPTGGTLDALPPADRTNLPDWRFAQRDSVRRQAEEARARQAMAGANQAVDVLTRALGNL